MPDFAAVPFNTDKLPGGSPAPVDTPAPSTGEKLEDRLQAIMNIVTGSGTTTQPGATPTATEAPTTIAPVGHLGVANAPTAGALAPSDIYKAALNAGFDSQQAIIMTAVALAESSGHPAAHNDNRNTGDNSYGLWQINMIDNLGPARQKQFGLSSYDDLFDPNVNAKAAYIVSGGGGNFSPWTTYTSGAYKNYLGEAQAAAQAG